MADRLGNPARAGRVTAPPQVVALDDEGVRDLAIGAALPLRPGADQDRATADRVERRRGVEPVEARPRPGQQVVDRGRDRPDYGTPSMSPYPAAVPER